MKLAVKITLEIKCASWDLLPEVFVSVSIILFHSHLWWLWNNEICSPVPKETWNSDSTHWENWKFQLWRSCEPNQTFRCFQDWQWNKYVTVTISKCYFEVGMLRHFMPAIFWMVINRLEFQRILVDTSLICHILQLTLQEVYQAEEHEKWFLISIRCRICFVSVTLSKLPNSSHLDSNFFIYSSSLWICYGILTENETLIFLNIIGCTLFISYITVFYFYTTFKVRILKFSQILYQFKSIIIVCSVLS